MQHCQHFENENCNQHDLLHEDEHGQRGNYDEHQQDSLYGLRANTNKCSVFMHVMN